MSAALTQARAAMRIKKAEPPVTGDAAIDALARELGRPLSPNEIFNLSEGLAHDFQPPPEVPFVDPDYDPSELPENALRRKAAAQKDAAS